MSVTIGTATFSRLTAQPFGYEETDTKAGLSSRKWLVQGLLQPSEWITLLGVYDAWRNTRISDDDTLFSGVVGTTVAFSGTGAGGQSWSNVACWFTAAPQAEQVGAYVSASCEVVDANQALQVLLRQQELQSESEDLLDLGSVTVGTTSLKLLKPMESYASGPQLELTASGGHYVSGPLVVQRVRDIEGTTNSTGWSNVRSWYESQIVSVPSVGSWFPVTPPSATAQSKIINGAKTTEYTISIQLGQVI